MHNDMGNHEYRTSRSSTSATDRLPPLFLFRLWYRLSGGLQATQGWEKERQRERERERDSLSPVARKSYDETASCPWQRRRRYRPVFAAGPTVTTAGVATPTNNNVTRAPRYPLPKLYFPWPVMSGWGWRWSRARGVGIALNRAPILPKRRRRTTAATIREYLSFPIQLFAFDSSFSIQLEF